MLALVLSLSFWSANAQQEQQYTQFMHNKLGFNPGYAGSYVSPTMIGVFRKQWIGLEGSPSTQVISYNQPLLNSRIGIGGNLVRNTIGINQNITLEFAYAYRFRIRRGWLGCGVQASIRHIRQNWADPRLSGTQNLLTDNSVPADVRSKAVPNFGMGLFYVSDKYFWGVSIPRLIQNNIDFAAAGAVLSREAQTLYGTAGVVFKIKEGIEVTPQILLKYVKNTPFDADINVNALFQKRFSGGLTYRTGGGQASAAGESIDVLAGIQANKSLYLGLSYDISLTKLRKYNSGSLEALVRYWLNVPEGEEYDNPRYF